MLFCSTCSIRFAREPSWSTRGRLKDSVLSCMRVRKMQRLPAGVSVGSQWAMGIASRNSIGRKGFLCFLPCKFGSYFWWCLRSFSRSRMATMLQMLLETVVCLLAFLCRCLTWDPAMIICKTKCGLLWFIYVLNFRFWPLRNCRIHPTLVVSVMFEEGAAGHPQEESCSC